MSMFKGKTMKSSHATTIRLTVGAMLWLVGNGVTGCAPQISPGMRDRGVSDYSLYSRVGGAPAITKLVDRFIDRVRLDPEIRFDDAGRQASWQPTEENVALLKKRFTQYLCVGLGGPELYAGRSVYQVHRPMKITQAQFDRFVQVFQECLAISDIPQECRDKMLVRFRNAANTIVGHMPISQPASSPTTQEQS